MVADFFASPRQGAVFRRFRGIIMGEINWYGDSYDVSRYDWASNSQSYLLKECVRISTVYVCV
jgi:hypothetical protein